MVVEIDASNILSGGGTVHLVETLSRLQPAECGVSRVDVWGSRRVLDLLPQRPWLRSMHHPMLEKGLWQRALWQKKVLSRGNSRQSDALFVPGGMFVGRHPQTVALSQNLLPFEPNERRRYGNSYTGFRLKLLSHLQAKTFRQAKGMIFLTQTARDVVTSRIGSLSGRSTVIPHGIVESFRLAPRPQEQLSGYSAQRPFKVLYVSIVDTYKHQWNVAEAVAGLRSKGLPLELTLVGPAYPPSLKRLKATLNRLDPGAEFLRYAGVVPYTELPGVYHNADMFVFASSCENLPNILLEAMASGLPIASSNRGPMPEVLGECGLYFDPESPEEIADSVDRLAQDSDLRGQCAARAFEASQRYSWDRCARETFEFIADIASEDCVCAA